MSKIITYDSVTEKPPTQGMGVAAVQRKYGGFEGWGKVDVSVEAYEKQGAGATSGALPLYKSIAV
jgi:hypothetical protein